MVEVGEMWWEAIPRGATLHDKANGIISFLFTENHEPRIAYVSLWDDTVLYVGGWPQGKRHDEIMAMTELCLCDTCGLLYDEAIGDGYMGDCPSCADKVVTNADI